MASVTNFNGTLGWQGWTSQPNGRGTIDILWSCVLTIGLCSWSSLCLTLPALEDGKWRVVRRKLYLSALGVTGPEFIFQIALGQWLSARRSVQEFMSAGHESWTMRHAFLADMGGFFLFPEGSPPFPLNAKQVFFLVDRGYVDKAKVLLPVKEIDDRNKREGFARILTVAQILWFLGNIIGRAVQHLAITTLELTTIAFVIPTLGTFLLWTKKPSDVVSPFQLELNTKLETILRDYEQPENDPLRRTPLDFVSRKEWSWTRYWEHFANFIRHCIGIIFGSQQRPISRIANDYCPEITGWGLFVLWLVQNIYGGIHFVAWNFEFPTEDERTGWKIATGLMVGMINLYWVNDLYTERIHPRVMAYLSRRKQKMGLDGKSHERSRPVPIWQRFWQRFTSACRNNSIGHDPEYDRPAGTMVVMYLVAWIYCASRAYILLEDVIVLRLLPASAFESVNWSAYLPHIGG